MSTTPKAKAVQLLRGLLDRAERLSPASRKDAPFALWHREAKDAVRNLFGEESTQHKSFAALTFFAFRHAWNAHTPPLTEHDHREAFDSALVSAKVQLTAMVTEIETYWPNDVARPEPRAPLATVLNMCDRFPDVVRQLLDRWGSRPVLAMKDEYDVQYLLGALLVVEFDDVRCEDPAPTHAGASTRRDFVLKAERIIIETKMTRDTLDDKTVAEELLADIARYEAVQDCDTLVCFVYDPGRRLRNPRGLERDLEKTASRLVVRVRVRT